MSFADIGARARKASFWLAKSSLNERNAILGLIRDALQNDIDHIVSVNKEDITEAKAHSTCSPSLISRLDFSESKVSQCMSGIDDVISLDDPLGKVSLSTSICPKQNLYRVSCPIGVLAIIYEARPEAGVQIASLAIKSGNSLILKGGTEARRTNNAIFAALQKGLQRANEQGIQVPYDIIQIVDTRDEVSALLKQDKFIDLVIPRGSNSLVRSVKSQTSIPVLGHADGKCHQFVDATADLKLALDVCVDSKTQYPAACNALETLLIHRNVAEEFIPLFANSMRNFEGAHLYCCENSLLLAPKDMSSAATDDTFDTEHLNYEIGIKIVNDLEEAISHINTHGSGHTDGIITNDTANVEAFFNEVDSANVYHNASTRFADGFRYGFGAEVGISTNKIHSRGPVGLEGLTIYKYRMYGHGETVGSIQKGFNRFEHVVFGKAEGIETVNDIIQFQKQH